MNRFKKYVRSKGFKLNQDYPWLPYFIKGKSIFEPGYIFVDGVSVNSEKCTVIRHLNILDEINKFNRDGSVTMDFD